jgi:thiosulfate/3-mercaptopyruvate sulfurtransferase
MRSPFFTAYVQSIRRVAIVSVALAALAGCAPAHAPWPRAVIEPHEVAAQLAHADTHKIVLLDIREMPVYQQGHVAGAVRVDPNTWQNESLAADTGIDHRARWCDRIGALGINGRQPVILYDDGRMTEAARLWFIFQHFNVPDVVVLNGGYPALAPLIADGRVPTSKDDTPAKPVPYLPPEHAVTRIGLVDRHEVVQAIENHRVRILDARTPEEFTGADLLKNPRGGHLPGAVNIPHKQLLDEQGRLKSPEALVKIFEQAGLKRGQTVITYCQSGGRASLAALAAERAGFGPILNYYWSFGDWSKDATCPLAAGD